jgi:hypothetical protein
MFLFEGEFFSYLYLIKNEKLQNGIYLYRIITNTGNQLKTGKIVVMK